MPALLFASGPYLADFLGPILILAAVFLGGSTIFLGRSAFSERGLWIGFGYYLRGTIAKLIGRTLIVVGIAFITICLGLLSVLFL